MYSLFSDSYNAYAEYDFSLLTDVLHQTGRKLQYEQGVTITPRADEVLVVISGLIGISDSYSGGMEIGYAPFLMPVGLVENYFPVNLYYHVESTTTLIQLTKEEFDFVFLSDPNRAELFSRIMSHMVASLIFIYYERNNDSGYATVREMIYRYDFRMKSKSLGVDEGIVPFILKRTRLSRSYVFQIIAGLKAGGYINIEKGKLIRINREIPERY